MKNDHTYEYRVFTNRLVDVGPMEVGNCTKKVVENLKSKDKVDGRFFHTSDTNEWFFCWNGKLQELNLAGDASVNEALEKVKELIGKADETVGLANDAAAAANEAVKQAQEAADAATSAVESIENKADQDYVDAVKQDVESLAQKVENKASISDLDNKANKSDLKGLATESYVVTKIAEAKLEGSDIIIPVQDVKVNGQTVVKDMIANIDLTPYAKSEDVPSIKGLVTEQWVTDQKYLTQHQDISHLASTTYVDDKLARKQDEITDLEDIRSKAKSALQSIPDECVTETELNAKGYLNEETLSTSGTIVEINKQIGEINNMITAAIKTTNTILDIKEE